MADAPAATSRATTLTEEMSPRFGLYSATQWEPGVTPVGVPADGVGELSLISHEVHVDGLANEIVRVGNDAWGFYTRSEDGGTLPTLSRAAARQATSYTGIVHYVFVRNETSKTMQDPWLELTGVTPYWVADPDLSGAPKADVGSVGRTMADWAGTSVGKQKGVPGPIEWDPTDDSTYDDYSGWDDLDSGLYERAMYYKHDRANTNWETDLGTFVATLRLWWYEDPNE